MLTSFCLLGFCCRHFGMAFRLFLANENAFRTCVNRQNVALTRRCRLAREDYGAPSNCPRMFQLKRTIRALTRCRPFTVVRFSSRSVGKFVLIGRRRYAVVFRDVMISTFLIN